MFTSNRLRSIEAAICGALIGAALFAGIGAWGNNAIIGAASGAFLGGIVGFFTYLGRIHRITVGAIFYALLSCVIGPGCDAYGGEAAIPFACVGAFIGWLGWRFLLTLPFACLGALLGTGRPDPTFAFIGFGIGAWLGTYVGAVFERLFDAARGALLAAAPTDEPFVKR